MLTGTVGFIGITIWAYFAGVWIKRTAREMRR